MPGAFIVCISGPLCVCMCAGARNSLMTRTFPLQVSLLCSPMRHGALSYEQCIVFWIVHLHTCWRRLFLWMTAVTKVLSLNFMLLVCPQMAVSLPIGDQILWFQTDLTSWHRVFLAKLIFAQFVKKVSTCYFRPKVHYHSHNGLTLDLILNHINKSRPSNYSL